MRSPSFAAVILAAGYFSRMGRDKALLPWRGGTFISAAIDSLSPHADFVLVVSGDNTETLKPIVYSKGAFLVRNPEPSRGQFSSLRVGLNEVLNRGRDTAIVTLVDRPAADRDTVAQIKREYLQAITPAQLLGAETDTWAVVPEFQGRHGHPFIAGREMIEAFLRAPLTHTARDVEHGHATHIRYIAVVDPKIVLNVDTPEEYDSLTQE
ncbi:MAG TPA: nucleotidyltransferase family protein [Terriglobales bacterium]